MHRFRVFRICDWSDGKQIFTDKSYQNLLFSYLSVSVPTEKWTLSNVGIVRNTVKLYGYRKSLWFFISFALIAVILLSIMESSKICSVKWFNDIEWAVKIIYRTYVYIYTYIINGIEIFYDPQNIESWIEEKQ